MSDPTPIVTYLILLLFLRPSSGWYKGLNYRLQCPCLTQRLYY